MKWADLGNQTRGGMHLRRARLETQRAHEQYNIRQFLSWHARRYKSSFEIIGSPNPPDALIRSGRTIRWVEAATVFWTDEYARDEYSFATPGEAHIPMRGGPHANMDKVFARRFAKLLQQKLEKDSYDPWRERYGPGYLVLRMMSPFFNHTTVDFMQSAWSEVAQLRDRGNFRSVLIAFRAQKGLGLKRWPHLH